MTPFWLAPLAVQSALLVGLFCSLLAGAFYLLLTGPGGGRRARWWNAWAVLALFLLLASLAASFDRAKDGLPAALTFELPLWALWGIMGVSLAAFAGQSALYLAQKGRAPGPHSVRQAMDTLPSGIGFFTGAGQPVLCNLQLYRLFWMLAGRDLQHLSELRQALAACGKNSRLARLAGEEDSYRFPDGSVWRCAETPVTLSDGTVFTQVVFSDMTELYQKGRELKEQAAQLEAFSRELKALSDNMLTLTKETEILAAKTRLHDEMGAGIVAIRQILCQQPPPLETAGENLRLFQRAVSALKSDSEAAPDALGGELAEFLRDAETIGVKVTLTGQMPQQPDAARLFVLALRECLSNGVRHADATELSAVIREDAGSVSLRVSNNGRPPLSEVTPRGGLLNLRRQTAALGGQMQLQWLPDFALTITLPTKREAAS